MALHVAIAGPGGGAGRTTLVLNLGVVLSERGHRVLMIDLDPQGGLGFLLSRTADDWAGVSDVLMGRVTLPRAVKRSNLSGLSLLARGRLGPDQVPEFEGAVRNQRLLRSLLDTAAHRFDVILMDLPAGLGMIPHGALSVADKVLVVARAEPNMKSALRRFAHGVTRIHDRANPKLDTLGVLTTMVDLSRPTSVHLVRDLREDGYPMFEVSVPVSPSFVTASARGQPVKRFTGHRSVEARPFEAVANRIAVPFAEETRRDALNERGQYAPFAEGDLKPLNAPESSADVLDAEFARDLGALPTNASFGIAEWHRFLDATLKATEGETAFVMSSEGLTIASRGRIPPGKIETLGNRVMMAIDQAKLMDVEAGEARTVFVQFERSWLTGIPIGSGSTFTFTVGVLGSGAVRPKVADRIRGTLVRLIQGLAGAQAEGIPEASSL